MSQRPFAVVDYHRDVIERVVLVRLKDEYRTDEQRTMVAKATRETLPDAAEVRALRVATPADERTRREWDLVIEVVLADLDAVERYRVDEVHRKYVDVFLRPMMEKIRAYNFEREDAEEDAVARHDGEGFGGARS